jgi:hypothetical protein
VPSECSCSVLAPGESLLAAVSLDVALPIGGVTRELHPAALWSLGENHVLLDARRWRHWRRSPWGRRLLRPRLAAVMLVPRYGFLSRCDFPVVRRARRGRLPHVGDISFLHGGRGSSSCCCAGYLQRTATAVIDAMASTVRDNIERWRLWQQQRGSTWLAADRDGLLQHGWNLPVRYNVGDGARDNLGPPV